MNYSILYGVATTHKHFTYNGEAINTFYTNILLQYALAICASPHFFVCLHNYLVLLSYFQLHIMKRFLQEFHAAIEIPSEASDRL